MCGLDKRVRGCCGRVVPDSARGREELRQIRPRLEW